MPEADRRVDRGAEARRLERVRPPDRQPEDVGGDLHDPVGPRAAAGDAQLGDRNLRAALASARRPRAARRRGPRRRPGRGAPGCGRRRSRSRPPWPPGPGSGRPARRSAGGSGPSPRAASAPRSSSRTSIGSTPAGARRGLLGGAELAAEPLDEPEPAVDLDLQAVRAGDRGRVRRDERDRLHVAPVRRVDRGRRPERQRADVRRERSPSRAPRRPCRRRRRSPAGRRAGRGARPRAAVSSPSRPPVGHELGQHVALDGRSPATSSRSPCAQRRRLKSNGR